VATVKVRLAKRQRQHSIPPLSLEELKEEKAVQFAAEVSNRFTALEAAHDEVTPENLWKGTKTVLLEVTRETIRSVKSQKKKKWISDDTYAVIREKREAKRKDKNRYQELKTEVQNKLTVNNSSSWRHVRGIRISKRERKFQTGLSDSQINDSKVSTTPAMYPVSK